MCAPRGSVLSIAHTWGSTPAERAVSLPCDRHLASFDDALFRAVDVSASPSIVFRWLCQLRVAPYSYDWIDNWGRESPRTLTPGLDQLTLGQRVMTIFELVDFERGCHLTLVLRRGRWLFVDIAGTYLVSPRAPTGSRIVVKLLVRYPHRAWLGWLRRVCLPWGDLVMMRKQLLTLKALAEADHAANSAPTGGATPSEPAASSSSRGKGQ